MRIKIISVILILLMITMVIPLLPHAEAAPGDDIYVYAAGDAGTIFKYLCSNMSLVATGPAYGGTIYSITQDSTYIYAGGDGTARVRKYWKSNLSFVAESPVYNSGVAILSIDQDASYIYATGKYYKPYSKAIGPYIDKYRKSDMALVAESPNYATMNDINALTSDTDYLYFGMQYYLYKMRKSDLSIIGSYPSGWNPQYPIRGITAVDANYVYYGGGTDKSSVVKLWKSNMSYAGETVATLPLGMTEDTTYIYVAQGNGYPGPGVGVGKYRKSDMAYVAQGSGTTYACGISQDTDNVYCGGYSAWAGVRKYRKSDMAQLATGPNNGGIRTVSSFYQEPLVPLITLISPQNNTILDRQTYANLTVNISGFETPIDVKFYNASSDTLLQQYTAVGLGVQYYNWTSLPVGIKQYWYVIVNGTSANNKSATWGFTPNNEPKTNSFRIDTINDNNITITWENEPNMEWISMKIGSDFMEVRKILGVSQSWSVFNLFKNTQYNLQWQLGDNLTSMSNYYDFNFRTNGWKPDIKNFTYRKLITVNRSGLSSDADNTAFNLTLTDDNFRYDSGPNWWDPNYPGFLHMNYTSKKDIRFTNYYNTKYYNFDIQSWNVPGEGGIETQVLPNETYYTGDFIDPTMAHDNDWNTKTTPSPHGVLFYNYTIPAGAKTTSKFRAYQGEYIWDVELPAGCYNGKLQFKSVCDYDTPYIGTYVWDYDASSWYSLQNDTARYFYETQMTWEYDAAVTIFVMPEHFDDASQTNVNGIDANYDTKIWMYYGNPDANDNETTLSYSGVYEGASTFGDEEEYSVSPPVISNVDEYNQTAASMNITWDTSEISSGRIKYATNPWFFGSTWAYSNANKTEVFEHLNGNESHVEMLYAYSPYYVATVDVNCSYNPYSNNPAYYYIDTSTGDKPAELHINATAQTGFLNWTITYTYNKTIEWDTYSPDFMIPNLPTTDTKYYYQILAIGEGGNTTYDGDFTLGTLPATPHASIVAYDEDRPNDTVTVWAELTDMNGLPYVNCSIQYWNEDSTDFSATSVTNMTSVGQFSKVIPVEYGHTYSYRVKAGDSTGYSDVRSNNFMPMQEFFAGNYNEDNDNNGSNLDARAREYRPPYANGTVNLSAKAYEQTGYWEGSLQTEDWMWVETNITDKGLPLTLHLYTKEYGHVDDYVMTKDTDSDMSYIRLTSLNSSWYTFYITGIDDQMVLNWTKPSLIHREHESRVDESKYVSFNATPSPVDYTLLYMDTHDVNTSVYRWSIASGLDIYSAMAVEYWGGGLETGLNEINVGTSYDRGQLFRGGVWNGEPYDTGTLEPTRNTKPMGANRYCFAFTSFDWNLSQLPSNNITNYYYRYWSLNNHWSEYLGYDQARLFDYNYLFQFKYDEISYTRDWKPIENTTIYTETRVDDADASVFNTDSNQSLLIGYKDGFNFDTSNDNIWNFGLYTDGRWTNQQVGQYQQAFVIFNLPDNATLLGMDSDSDNLNDYAELFTYYTNPKSVDTDEDGFNDDVEIAAGTDPNNYKDLPQPPSITIYAPLVPDTTFQDNVSLSALISSDYAVDYNISIWTYAGAFVELIESGTTPVGGDTINTYWNSTAQPPGRYVLKINATDEYNPTVYATRNFYISSITIANESPLDGATNLSLGFDWTVYISDVNGKTFNWTISCSNGQQSYGNNESNGTKKLTLTGLPQNVTQIVTVTVDGPLSIYYSFTTGEFGPELTIVLPNEDQAYPVGDILPTQTIIESYYVVDYNISIWSLSGDLIQVLQSNTTPLGGETLQINWNSTGNPVGQYVLKVNATDNRKPMVYATRNFSLVPFSRKTIDVTLTPMGTVNIIVTPKVWDGGGASIGENRSTASDAFTVENNGTVYVDISVEATDTTNWVLLSTPAHNQFQMQWTFGAGWYNLGLTPSPFIDALACGEIQPFGLKIFMPTSSSTSTNQTSTITFTATAN